jgi:hypothetical protein
LTNKVEPVILTWPLTFSLNTHDRLNEDPLSHYIVPYSPEGGDRDFRSYSEMLTAKKIIRFKTEYQLQKYNQKLHVYFQGF